VNVKLADDGQNDENITLHFYIDSIIHSVIFPPQMTILELLQDTCSRRPMEQQRAPDITLQQWHATYKQQLTDTARQKKKMMYKEHLDKRVGKEMWAAGFRYSWREMKW